MVRPTGWSTYRCAELHPWILELVGQGLSDEAVAQRVGMTAGTVSRVRRRAGIKRQQARRFTAEECATIEAMLDDGCSYEEIGRTVGRHASTICWKWPGRGWDKQAASQFALWVRHHESKLMK